MRKSFSNWGLFLKNPATFDNYVQGIITELPRDISAKLHTRNSLEVW